MSRLVLIGLLTARACAFAPAPIRWGAGHGNNFVAAPSAISKVGVVADSAALPAKLSISDHVGAPSELPQFTPKLDSTIAWEAKGLCVEAIGDQNGDAVGVNRCTGKPAQLWNFVPWGQGKTQIQLRGTSKCIDVSSSEGALNGAAMELRECDNRATESWSFEEPLPLPITQTQGLALLSEARHVMISLLALAGVGAFSLSAWLWQRWSKPQTVFASQGGMPSNVELEGGLSLASPIAFSGSDSHKPIARPQSVPMHRGGNVSMSVTLEKETKADDSAAHPDESVANMDDFDTHGSVMTLSRFMIEQAQKNPDLRTMESLMTSIQMACKQIANLVARAGIQDLTGLQEGGGSVNIQGEEQKKLDVITNNVMKNCLRFSGRVGVLGSEEEDDPVLIEDTFDGRYSAVFDPLDGSSNVDAAVSTGTIFGIFEDADDDECMLPEDAADLSADQVECLNQTLKPGKKLRASGYCMYSSSTIFVMTMGNGVNGFTLDPTIGEFVLTHPNMQIPKRGKIYSVNESNTPEWPQALQDYINNIKNGTGQSGAKYSARYIGSMVGDVHRTLLYGGMYGYPGDKANPDGKLRLLYEGAPMAFIVEQAGGKCTTGSQDIMEIVPTSVHQRVPVFLGSPDDIDEVTDVYKKAGIELNY